MKRLKDILGKAFWMIVVDAIIIGLVLAVCAIEVAVTKQVPYDVRHLWYGDSLSHYFRFNHIVNTAAGIFFCIIGDIGIAVGL